VSHREEFEATVYFTRQRVVRRYKGKEYVHVYRQLVIQVPRDVVKRMGLRHKDKVVVTITKVE